MAGERLQRKLFVAWRLRRRGAVGGAGPVPHRNLVMVIHPIIRQLVFGAGRLGGEAWGRGLPAWGWGLRAGGWGTLGRDRGSGQAGGEVGVLCPTS